MSDTQWIQASLPIRDDALGVRRADALALPSFNASVHSTKTYRQPYSELAETQAPDCPYLTSYVHRWSGPYARYVLKQEDTLSNSMHGTKRSLSTTGQ